MQVNTHRGDSELESLLHRPPLLLRMSIQALTKISEQLDVVDRLGIVLGVFPGVRKRGQLTER